MSPTELWLPEAMDSRVIIVGSLDHYGDKAQHSNHGKRERSKTPFFDSIPTHIYLFI